MYKALTVFFGAASLTGCLATSGYTEFYVDEIGEASVSVAPSTVETPALYRMSDSWEKDHYAAFRDGYVLIGSASFSGPLERRENLIRQAQKVGAEFVITRKEFLRSVDYLDSYTTSSPVTSFHSGSIYGHGFSGSYSGTTTTRVQETKYYLRTVDRYNQDTLFYAKRKPSCLGLLTFEPTKEHLRQMPGLYPEVMVVAVREGSPAAAAGFERLDRFHTVNGQEITWVTDIPPLPSFQDVEIVVHRGTRDIAMTVTTGDCTQPRTLHSGI